jgi:hypothetical protein
MGVRRQVAERSPMALLLWILPWTLSWARIESWSDARDGHRQGKAEPTTVRLIGALQCIPPPEVHDPPPPPGLSGACEDDQYTGARRVVRMIPIPGIAPIDAIP